MSEADSLEGFPPKLRQSYRPLRVIGRGAMGIVFECQHLTLGRSVALKVMDPSLAEDEDRARFTREVRSLAKLDHPTIVKLFDADVLDRAPYLAMELLEGETLEERLATGPLDEKSTRAILHDILSALGHLHERSLLHRDLKPSNVFLRKDGRPVLIDFGLARPGGGARTLITEAGRCVGTPAYMAPEQLRAEDHSVASDLFAVGLVGIRAWTGRTVHGDVNSLTDIYAGLASGTYHAGATRLLAERGGLAAPLLRAILPDPRDRFGSAAEMSEALERSGRPRPHSRGERRAAGEPTPVRVPLPAQGMPTPARVSLPPPRRSGAWIAGALAVFTAVGFLAFGRAPPARPAVEVPSPSALAASPGPGGDAWTAQVGEVGQLMTSAAEAVQRQLVVSSVEFLGSTRSLRDPGAVAAPLVRALRALSGMIRTADAQPIDAAREVLIEASVNVLLDALSKHSVEQRRGMVLREFEALGAQLSARAASHATRAAVAAIFTEQFDDLSGARTRRFEQSARNLQQLAELGERTTVPGGALRYLADLWQRAAIAWAHTTPGQPAGAAECACRLRAARYSDTLVDRYLSLRTVPERALLLIAADGAVNALPCASEGERPALEASARRVRALMEDPVEGPWLTKSLDAHTLSALRALTAKPR